jgi:hypothetical protein
MRCSYEALLTEPDERDTLWLYPDRFSDVEHVPGARIPDFDFGRAYLPVLMQRVDPCRFKRMR